MGSSICIAAPQDLQRRENMKNRCNPTEPADQWRVKMLHDIGADPLAVIRDFPRMMVEVDTRVYRSASAAAAAAAEALPNYYNNNSVSASTRQAHNPLVHGAEADLSKSSTTTTNITSSEHNPQRSATAGTITALPPTQLDAALHAETEDAMAQRGRRVKRTVLQLAELCQEQESFGVRFAAAWDAFWAQHQNDETQFGAEVNNSRLLHLSQAESSANEAEGLVDEGHTHIAEDEEDEEEEIDRLHASALVPGSHRYGGLRPLSLARHRHRFNAHGVSDSRPATRRNRAAGVVTHAIVDIHQCMLHACLASGMLIAVNTDTTNIAGPNNSLHTYPALGNGAGRRSSVANRSAVNTTMNTTAEQSQLTHLSLVPTVYHVRSATFHLMQYMTQGVMFYPVQRLQHVLWMSWSSHLQDIAWQVQVSCYEQPMRDAIRGRGERTANITGAATSQSSQHNSPALLQSVSHDPRLALTGPAHSLSEVVAGNMNTTSPESTQRVLLVRHLQTARHYVEKAARKSVPCYELDWACTIRIDANELRAPYVHSETIQTEEEEEERAMRGSVNGTMNASHPVSAQPSCGPSVTSAHSHLDNAPVIGHSGPSANVSQRNNTTTTAAATAGMDMAQYIDTPPRYNSEKGFPCGLEGREDAPFAATRQTTTTLPGTNATTTTPSATTKTTTPTPGPAAVTTTITAASGVAAAQQPNYVTREVLSADVGVVAARVERPPQILGFTSAAWGRRKEEFEYVLENQYKVPLLDVTAHSKVVRGGISR